VSRHRHLPAHKNEERQKPEISSSNHNCVISSAITSETDYIASINKKEKKAFLNISRQDDGSSSGGKARRRRRE